MQSDSENPISIDDLAKQIVALREKPLLVLYYTNNIAISHTDHEIVYDKLTEHIEEKIKDLDVLIHCHGGSCDGSYLVSRAICDCTEKSTSLVPYHAISGGTMIALSANNILFGGCARLSAIDTLETKKKNDSVHTDDDLRELLWLNRYVSFVMDTKSRIEDICECKTNVEDTLLKALVENAGAENIGCCERAIEIPAAYSRVLLRRMHPENEDLRDEIGKRLVYGLPAHSFVVDYDIANNFGIVCEKMPFALSKITKQYVKALDDSYSNKDICQDGDPFVEYYPLQ